MIPIKNSKEIILMQDAGKLLANIMNKVVLKIVPGVSTLELDKFTQDMILKAGAKPAFKNYKYHGNVYPATLCTSVNDSVVHEIPNNKKILKIGDIIGLDCGLNYNGYFSDMAVTVSVGKISKQVQKLINVTKGALDIAIKTIKPGIHLGNVSFAIQSYVEKKGFSVVKELSGHGIGKQLHEEPTILNYGHLNTGPILKTGMCLALEPMVNVGDWKIKVLNDNWTCVTADKSLSAHFEHTVLITKTGSQILTKI